MGIDTFRLDDEEMDDHLSATAFLESQAQILYRDAAAGKPNGGIVPPSALDHLARQTPIRNQLDRGTCVCFASLAGIEAILKDREDEHDLSEQYANWLFMKNLGRDQCDDGLRTTRAAAATSCTAFGSTCRPEGCVIQTGHESGGEGRALPRAIEVEGIKAGTAVIELAPINRLTRQLVAGAQPVRIEIVVESA